ncbi:MAG: hypothetical protein M3R38_18095 [Actinomycetota bacterium]|nr:hypothetical protein [Actinomycetota bacterium]
MTEQWFELGVVVATPAALEELARAGISPLSLLKRHASGDWGDVDAHDRRANDAALKHGTRIFSSYSLDAGLKLWVITEADRSSTCILRPEEY